jgi:hypothetical protein
MCKSPLLLQAPTGCILLHPGPLHRAFPPLGPPLAQDAAQDSRTHGRFLLAQGHLHLHHCLPQARLHRRPSRDLSSRLLRPPRILHRNSSAPRTRLPDASDVACGFGSPRTAGDHFLLGGYPGVPQATGHPHLLQAPCRTSARRPAQRSSLPLHLHPVAPSLHQARAAAPHGSHTHSTGGQRPRHVNPRQGWISPAPRCSPH